MWQVQRSNTDIEALRKSWKEVKHAQLMDAREREEERRWDQEFHRRRQDLQGQQAMSSQRRFGGVALQSMILSFKGGGFGKFFFFNRLCHNIHATIAYIYSFVDWLADIKNYQLAFYIPIFFLSFLG